MPLLVRDYKLTYFLYPMLSSGLNRPIENATKMFWEIKTGKTYTVGEHDH